ncbi:uncharacterized protein B0I36DRAFT_357359 [Microdochium trichocladiopsis]|uniref:Uncharacterized protein n=1 Tax=Microdochium trichocladiopsis TaxID=1682393 RepID=A0A9P8YHB7_9PEZI|nr:uncharacterized protein B0I36DRAFT_357359 [Microdochium trichocladiopsis]KAH7039998.1 hypothetical protein B0I36DRAFT_357359 [Microdochium trichocladiopsis]
MSPERFNQQQQQLPESPLFASIRSSENHRSLRDSEVHDKIRQFNNLATGSVGHMAMSKQLERKTADAALRRAMLGREEAETEMRRYREEARALRAAVEEGRERERKVGERLETVMENYGRAKETFSHTQSLWEKEIRRARKETFKSQSSIVKLQEELKSARAVTKSAEEALEREKERSKAREQEAFSARYQIVGVQEQLDKALEQIKVVEQERDAFKTLAKNEEVARIAAEGRLPLPAPAGEDDEFGSPKRKAVPRVSLSTMDIVSSAASEAEIDDLTRLWQWEKKRADRAVEQIEFLEAECQLKVCSCASARKRRSLPGSVRKERSGPVAIVDPADHMILGRKKTPSTQSPSPARHAEVPSIATTEAPTSPVADKQPSPVQQKLPKEPRRSTIFVPAEGIFRTLSQQDLTALNDDSEQKQEIPSEEVQESPHSVPASPAPTTEAEDEEMSRAYARTPSVEPPSFAMMVKERTSLLSLLNAPRESEAHCEPMTINIPTTSGDAPMTDAEAEELSDAETVSPDSPVKVKEEEEVIDETADLEERPHTSAAFYTVTTTTTVAVRQDNEESAGPRKVFSFARAEPSFDVNNPALTPTMTREEALAQIKARRGRARSAMQGAMTPRKQMITGLGERRDISAPAGRVTKART